MPSLPRILRKMTAGAGHPGSFKRFLLPVFAFLISFSLQGQIQVSNYTACPNQTVQVNVSWPNVAITNLSLAIPNGGSATNNGNLQTLTQFTISHPGPATVQFTIYGVGQGNSGQTTSTVNFNLTIQPPPALSFTNQVNYCFGSTATIITNPGGDYYTLSGTQNLGPYQTNVIIIPNLNAGHTGTYLVTSVGSCTQTGVTTLNISPNTPISVTSVTNVCQDSTAYIQASMAGGSNWIWYDQQTTQVGTGPLLQLSQIQPAQSGTYTVYSELSFNGMPCPRTATAVVNVVQTEQVVPSASPSRQLCQGEKLSLSANAGLNVIGFSWSGPCNFGPVSVNSPTIFPSVPCNSGIYTVTAYFTNNFLTCATRGTIEVEIVPTSAPIPSVPAMVCQGGNVNLSATAGGGVSSWHWFGPNFTANTPSATINGVQPDRSGPYVITVVYTSTNLALGTKACSVSSQPQQLTVITVNSVSVIPPPPVCTPQNAQLASSAPGAVAFEWQGPNNFSYNGASPTIFYPTTAYTGVYTVTAFFGSLMCPKSNTVFLKVNPVMNFSLIPRTLACFNSSFSIPGPSGADSYTWTSSTGFKSNSKDLFIPSVLPGDQGTYTLNLSLGPCITRAETELVVIEPIQFTLTPKSRQLCAGMTTTLETGVTGGSQNYAYAYNPPLYMDSPYGPVKEITPMGTVQYNVLVHDIACPSFTLGHTFLVDVLPSPKPRLAFAKDRFCDGICQHYKVLIDSADAINTIDFGGNRKYQIANGDSILECLPQGSHKIRVSSVGTNGCTGSFEYPYPIMVDPRPGSSIALNPAQPNTTEEVRFEAVHSNSTEITYQGWFFQGGVPVVTDTSDLGASADTTNELYPRRRYNSYGKYPVLLVTQNEFGCYDSIVSFINVIDLFSVYIPDAFTPNEDGVNDVFAVKGMGIAEDGFTMDIFNRKGQNIFTTKDLNEPWDGTQNGRKCMDGVYTYKIRVVSMNGEGRKEFIGRVALLK